MFPDLDFYAFALNASLIMAVVVVALSVYAVFSHLQSDHLRHRANRLRPRMQRALAAYLDHRALLAQTLPALASDRQLALGVLLGVASARGGRVQLQLRPVFDHFDFEKTELHGLTQRDFARRVRAANHLGYLGGKAAGSALLIALKDEQLEVRLAAAQSLVQLRVVDAAIPILEALALPGRWAQQRATDLMYGFGPAVVPLLQEFLDGAGEQVTTEMRVAAINAVGMLGCTTAPSPIRAGLHSDHFEIRVAAARALGGIGDVGVTDDLTEALRDGSWEVRSQAAKSLGKLPLAGAQQSAAISALDGALSDKTWWVRYNAASALAELGTPGWQALQRALTAHADPFARDISRQMLEERSIVRAPARLPA